MKESLTQLLVHLDASPRAARRLEVARAIAQTHGAAVTALYAVTPALLVVPFAPEAGPSVANALGQIDEERRAQARAAFDRSVADARRPRGVGARCRTIPSCRLSPARPCTPTCWCWASTIRRMPTPPACPSISPRP